MMELDNPEDIKEFIKKHGLDEDEESDSEVYRQTGELIAEFFRSIEHRLASIAYRLSRLEREKLYKQI